MPVQPIKLLALMAALERGLGFVGERRGHWVGEVPDPPSLTLRSSPRPRRQVYPQTQLLTGTSHKPFIYFHLLETVRPDRPPEQHIQMT